MKSKGKLQGTGTPPSRWRAASARRGDRAILKILETQRDFMGSSNLVVISSPKISKYIFGQICIWFNNSNDSNMAFSGDDHWI